MQSKTHIEGPPGMRRKTHIEGPPGMRRKTHIEGSPSLVCEEKHMLRATWYVKKIAHSEPICTPLRLL